MKSYIINIIVIAVFAFINIAFGVSKEVYRNVDQNEVSRTTTISLYEGESGINLVPSRKYVFSHMENNMPAKKIVYKWNMQKSEWVLTDRYEYLYNESGFPEVFTRSEWNAKKKNWDTDLQYPIYLFDINEDLLTINTY